VRLKLSPKTLLAAPILLIAAGLFMGSRHKTAAAAGYSRRGLLQQRNPPVTREWVGTLTGLVNADVNAEVPGYLLW
jgi:hypothetical protein